MELKECRDLADKLIEQHGLAKFGWHFNFDNAKKRGGLCDYRFRRISMSRYLVPLWTREQVEQTLLHEIAHALAGGVGHGPLWLHTARSIGYTGDRCHSNEVVEPRFHAYCPNCVRVVAKRHRRMRSALHLACNTRIEWIDTLVAA